MVSIKTINEKYLQVSTDLKQSETSLPSTEASAEVITTDIFDEVVAHMKRQRAPKLAAASTAE